MLEGFCCDVLFSCLFFFTWSHSASFPFMFCSCAIFLHVFVFLAYAFVCEFDTLSNVQIRPRVRPSRVHTVLHHSFHKRWWLRLESWTWTHLVKPGAAGRVKESLGSFLPDCTCGPATHATRYCTPTGIMYWPTSRLPLFAFPCLPWRRQQALPCNKHIQHNCDRWDAS
jgi:hypothetical protein